MKKTYRIGQVARMLGLETYVLRFWDSEFPLLVPARTQKGQRFYTEKHIADIRRIQYLLHTQGMTIEGARRLLAREKDSGPQQLTSSYSYAQLRETLRTVRNAVKELYDQLCNASHDTPSKKSDLP